MPSEELKRVKGFKGFGIDIRQVESRYGHIWSMGAKVSISGKPKGTWILYKEFRLESDVHARYGPAIYSAEVSPCEACC